MKASDKGEKDEQSNTFTTPVIVPRAESIDISTFIPTERTIGQSDDYFLPFRSGKEGKTSSSSGELSEDQIYTALSIDGGGIRGILPVLWLEKLQEKYCEIFGVTFALHQAFDCVGGTSIGGILSFGIAADIPLKNIKTIFSDSESRDKIFPPAETMKTIKSLFGLLSHRYESKPLETLLQTTFGKQTTFKALKTDVFVTACTTNGKPWSFRREQPYLLWQAARATSAAPTYFEAFTINDYEDRPVHLVDGGLWINNPSIHVAAMLMKKKQDYNPSHYRILSLGTGINPPQKFVPESAGYINAGGIINLLMSSSQVGNHEGMISYFDKNYYRFNPSLNKAVNLDDISPESFNDLIEAATQDIKENHHRLDEFVSETQEAIRKKLERGEYKKKPAEELNLREEKETDSKNKGKEKQEDN